MIPTIILAVCVMLALAGVFAVLLGWANIRWHVHVPEQLQHLMDAMPGANCGGCGYIGCSEYAEAVFHDGAPPDKCPVGGSAVAQRIAEIMGIEHIAGAPSRPVVLCGADFDARLKRPEYRGERTCSAAVMVVGVQGCTYGCLGFSDCVEVCKFYAIHIINGLAVVDYEKCVGCGACVRACPRNIIQMVPFHADAMAVVACSNLDPGKIVRGDCTVGCIACGICAKLDDIFTVADNNASIDYDRYQAGTDLSASIEKCPRKIIRMIGK